MADAAVAGGAGLGAVLGFATSAITNRATNKAALRQINALGENLLITTRAININREQLDRELGDVLTENALATAKDMATAKVLMSTSGTVGGTTRAVAKQAYINQIRSDADLISKARNQDISLLNQAISERINFRTQAASVASQIKTPMEAMFGTLNAIVSGASTGAALGQALSTAPTGTTPRAAGTPPTR